MKCKYCGREIPDDSNFCEFCGKKVIGSKRWAWYVVILLVVVALGALIGPLLVGGYEDSVGQEVGTSVPMGYVDLGLPSGTYWKALNESGFYTYDEAVSRFGSNLPSDSQLQELKDYCQWTWTGSGYKVVGPNGNSIVLPAAGFRYCDGSVGSVGGRGRYWSSTASGSEWAMSLYFYSGGVNLYSDYRCDGYSVRLVQD